MIIFNRENALFFTVRLHSCTVSIRDGPMMVTGNLCYKETLRLECMRAIYRAFSTAKRYTVADKALL